MTDLDTEIRTAMTADVTTVAPDCTLREAADVLRTEGIGSVVVEDDPLGIVTKTDLVDGLRDRADPEETTVEALMTTRPVTIDAAAEVREAVETMNRHGVKRLPVTDDGSVVGIVTTTDLVETIAAGSGRESETVVGVFAELFGRVEDDRYECVECGTRLSASHHPGSCSECGGRVRNIGVTQE